MRIGCRHVLRSIVYNMVSVSGRHTVRLSTPISHTGRLGPGGGGGAIVATGVSTVSASDSVTPVLRFKKISHAALPIRVLELGLIWIATVTFHLADITDGAIYRILV